ncbi:DUF302 domain-containing protein [Aliishimia ponticola]|uniref:DUF302 domain-containing protein n=1 Tax=Aliishimia ponticola TaxID=2499833 RepID=A0A4S4NIJ9_9RHOB|nr:DUF302 domain-containing protein [Aliishimia ponticola]THH38031.1 DUF302 domain-containing protein [Aliishimia ponticola]
MLKAMMTAACLMAAPALAGEAVTTPYDGSFEDATFAVETAIVGQGLKIDYTSHVGEMLARTGADVGSTTEIFKAADIFLFCSASLSREVMEADPMNIAHCPYGVFVAQTADGVVIGHRKYPEGEMQKVEALLDEIVKEAVSF